jgi:hypothetical protein
MFRVIVFFSLITSALANTKLDALVSAAKSFSAAIQQQLATVQSNPASADFARNTIAYAQAKTAYFAALREEMPELIDIATGRQPRPSQLDKIAAVLSSADEKQKTVAEQKTIMFLKRFSGKPNVKKAEVEFERAQEVEQTFHKDFQWQDFAS